MERGAFVNLDLEQFRYRDLTYTVFTELLDEEEFRAYDQAGVVVQAYLRDARNDLEALIGWARSRSRPLTVRLVKGAYWDYETVLARQEGWPTPVFTHKPDSDVAFERLARLMLESVDVVRPAFASHNVRSLAAAVATARRLGVPDDGFEIQMLHGMGDPIKAAVRAMGLRLREYAPGRRAHPGHGLLRAPPAREHGQRVVPARRLRRGRRRRGADRAAGAVAGVRRAATAPAGRRPRPTPPRLARSPTCRTPTSPASRAGVRPFRRCAWSTAGRRATSRC